MMEEKKSFLYFKFCTNSNFTKKKLMETEVLGGKPSRYFCKKKCLKIIFKQSNELSSKKAIKKKWWKSPYFFRATMFQKILILTKVVSTNDSISFTREGERIVHFTQQNFSFIRLWDRVSNLSHFQFIHHYF